MSSLTDIRSMVMVALGCAVVLGTLAASAPTGAQASNARSTSIVVDPPVLPDDPVIPAPTVHVSTYGAVPDDAQDDTAGIQAAIDDVSGSGGGSIMFAPGRYDISIGPVSNQIALALRSNVRLAAQQPGETTIRLADNQGEFRTIFWTDSTISDEDIVLEGLVIDGNSQNNGWYRYTVDFNNGSRLLITGCEFINHNNRVVTRLLDAEDGQVLDSAFENILSQGGAVGIDHSSIFTFGDRMLIADNTFSTQTGPGPLGVNTAIEVHDDDQTVVGNTIIGYRKGMIVSGAGLGGRANRQLVAENIMDDVSGGIIMWSSDAETPPGEPAMENIEIRDNEITINVDDWNDSGLNANYRGIFTHGYQTPHPFQAVSITGNEIQFTNFSASAQDPSFEGDLVGGISLNWNQSNQADPTTFIDLYIADNHIVNALSSGIWSTSSIEGVEITSNTIINPGRHEHLSDIDYRTGVYIEGTASDNPTSNILVSQNDTQDTTQPTLLEYGVVAGSECTANCTAINNTVDPVSVPELKADPSWND